MEVNSTAEEVAARYRTTPETVHYWVKIGKLKGFKVGRRRLFSEDELAAFEEAAKAA